jgi:hypothetical protein
MPTVTNPGTDPEQALQQLYAPAGRRSSSRFPS